LAEADDEDAEFCGHRFFHGDGSLAGKAGVGRCENEDDGAVKDLANRLGRIEQGENAVQHRQDQRADDGARISAAAAEDRGPPMITAATDGKR
jgi:hypothetical protein